MPTNENKTDLPKRNNKITLKAAYRPTQGDYRGDLSAGHGIEFFSPKNLSSVFFIFSGGQ